MSELDFYITGNKLIVSETGFPTHTFELVNEFPLGYSIWHIGSSHMPKGYLPLCRLSAHQLFSGGRNIEPDTLKAIKIDCAEQIMDAISGCEGTLEALEAYIARNKNAKPDTWEYRQVQQIEAVLPALKSICIST